MKATSLIKNFLFRFQAYTKQATEIKHLPCSKIIAYVCVRRFSSPEYHAVMRVTMAYKNQIVQKNSSVKWV